MLSDCTLVSVLLLTGDTFTASLGHVLHEKRSIPLSNSRQRIDGESTNPIRIGLRKSNLHTGLEMLMDISHPISENYGKYLSKDEVHSIFFPAEETVKL